jgi:hypothetical protein
MIVWLASYPRSGNTLLRTMLRQALNIDSYSDHPIPRNIGLTKETKSKFGHLDYKGSWEHFYQKARDSQDIYFVKTHLPPRDEEPVIYVVRDGRRSILSYRDYHQSFFPEYPGGLWELVLGADYYGGWSEHYAHWHREKVECLTLRYEDLVSAPSSVLRKIVEFVGNIEQRSDWQNSFSELRQENPSFFRHGKVTWDEPKEWTQEINAAFMYLHGALMIDLGYVQRSVVTESLSQTAPGLIELIEVARSIQRDRNALASTCGERLRVIESLQERESLIRRAKSLMSRLFGRAGAWGR